MENGTKKTKFMPSVFMTWKGFTEWLALETDEQCLIDALSYELKTENRAAYLDRIRTRFNRVRAERELKALEEASGQPISIYRKPGGRSV